MSSHYLIEIIDQENGRYTWLDVNAPHISNSKREGGASDLASAVNDGEVTLLLDAAKLRVARATIPGRSEQQVKVAARYALEDDIASDIDGVDVSLLTTDQGAERVAVVSDDQWLRDVLQPLTNAGVNISAALPNALLVEREANEISIVCDREAIMVRYGDLLATSMDPSNLEILLPRIVKACNARRLKFTALANSEMTEDKATYLSSICGDSLDFAFKDLNCDRLSYLAEQFSSTTTPRSLNYLPTHLQTTRQDNFVSAGLKVAAAIFGLAIVAHIGLDWHAITRYEAALDDVKSQQEAIFRDAFPNVKRVVNAEAQSVQALRDLENVGPPPAEFLDVLHGSTKLLEGDDLGVELIGMTYADGVLLLRTQSLNMEQLEQYQAALTKDLVAEVVTAESNNNLVRGSIRVHASNE